MLYIINFAMTDEPTLKFSRDIWKFQVGISFEESTKDQRI